MGVTRSAKGNLGTFLGVFTPSVLTILGVILYLRTGWVVGNVGLAGAIAIVVVANAITFVTALSIASVATNMDVGAGGAYYMISRSLGVEIGAAIGLPLFLAQAFSVTLYAYGFAESLQFVWPDLPEAPVAALTVLVVALVAGRGAGVALRLQLPILAAIAVSLVVFFIGVGVNVQDSVELFDRVPRGETFWVVFAVFFPAVTGIMAGVSLSGDLRDPKRSIPRGTIVAVVVGFVVYLLVTIGLAAAATPAELVTDPLIWFTIAGGLAFLIYPGLWGAIVSSAVGSILGAPRTLEAMVNDRVLPRPLGRRVGSIEGSGVPLLISAGIALTAVGLGGLNAVAPVLTIFFLTTYGMINLVAGLERLSGDPSFRPSVRVPWVVSLAGALACFWVMFLISPLASVVAFVVELGIYIVMRRRALTARWGDLRRSALVALVRSTVFQLRRLPEEPRNWRPNVLLVTEKLEREPELARYGSLLVQDRGILTVSQLIEGSLESFAASIGAERRALNERLEGLGITGFGEVEVVPDFERGVVAVAQANGIAGIESNTVMFGWSDDRPRMAGVLRAVERLALLDKASVICRPLPFESLRRRRVIHVWWGGMQHNGDLLVLLAHLISLDPAWRDAEIEIKSVATSDMIAERTATSLQRMIASARIDATLEVIKRRDGGGSIQETIAERSQEADVVLLGLKTIGMAEAEDQVERLRGMLAGLPTAILVRSAGPFRGQLLGVEDDGAQLA